MYSLFLRYRYNLAFILVLAIGLTQILEEYFENGANWGMIILALAMFGALYGLYNRDLWGCGFVVFYSVLNFLFAIASLVLHSGNFDTSLIFPLVTIPLSVPLFLISLIYFRNSRMFTLGEDELIARFIHFSKLYELSRDRKYGAELWRLYSVLGYKDDNLIKLSELLVHENDCVKLNAAYFLLAKHEDKALKTIDEISKKEGPNAAQAKITADLWRKGEKEAFKY